jgi:hypothetical protein
MKKLLALAVATAALSAVSAPAFAQSNNGGGTSTLNFTVGYSCTVDGGGSNPFNGTFDLSSANILDSSLNVVPNVSLGQNLVAAGKAISCTGSGAVLSAKTVNGGLTYGNVLATSTVYPGSLSYLPTIYYTTTVNWGGGTAQAKTVTLTANGTPAATIHSSATTGTLLNGPVTATATTIPSRGPLIAGTYTDTLTIQVGDTL